MISFFSRPAFNVYDKRDGTPYIKRLSSIIRGKQIADYLGARFNPDDNDGTCIYLKPLKIDGIKDGDYVDIADDITIHAKLGSLISRLKNRPGINVMAMTTAHKEWLEQQLPNKVVHVPHAHVNFERNKRTKNEVTTCGYIGSYVGRHEDACKKLGKELEKIGMKFIYTFTYPKREDILNFYDNIDIQVIPMFDYLVNTPQYHEKKIVDAMSFGIPTVSEKRLGYRDVDEYYYKVKNMSEMIAKVKELKNGWDAQRLIDKAEEYHISKIAEIYKKL